MLILVSTFNHLCTQTHPKWTHPKCSHTQTHTPLLRRLGLDWDRLDLRHCVLLPHTPPESQTSMLCCSLYQSETHSGKRSHTHLNYFDSLKTKWKTMEKLSCVCFLYINFSVATYHNRQKGHPIHLGFIYIIPCHVQDSWAQIYICYK